MFTLPGLTPDADYQFRIVAVNNIGESEAGPVSDAVTCKDPFGEPPQSNVVCVGVSESQKQLMIKLVFCFFRSRQAKPTRRDRHSEREKQLHHHPLASSRV